MNPAQYIEHVKKTELHINQDEKYECLKYDIRITSLLKKMWEYSPKFCPDIKTVLSESQSISLSYLENILNNNSQEVNIAKVNDQ